MIEMLKILFVIIMNFPFFLAEPLLYLTLRDSFVTYTVLFFGLSEVIHLFSSNLLVLVTYNLEVVLIGSIILHLNPKTSVISFDAVSKSDWLKSPNPEI